MKWFAQHIGRQQFLRFLALDELEREAIDTERRKIERRVRSDA